MNEKGPEYTGLGYIVYNFVIFQIVASLCAWVAFELYHADWGIWLNWLRIILTVIFTLEVPTAYGILGYVLYTVIRAKPLRRERQIRNCEKWIRFQTKALTKSYKEVVNPAGKETFFGKSEMLALLSSVDNAIHASVDIKRIRSWVAEELPQGVPAPRFFFDSQRYAINGSEYLTISFGGIAYTV